jgi:hypothetical protein
VTQVLSGGSFSLNTSSMKTIIWAYKAILLLFFFNSCQPKPAPPLTYNPLPIVKLLMFDRDLYERFWFTDREDYELWKLGVWLVDSAMFDGHRLKAYSFEKGGGVGGPKDRILSFCWNKKKFDQVEFVFKGENEMSLMQQSEPRKDGNNATLGRQLSHFARYYGPELSKNKDSLKMFLITVMTRLFQYPLITKEQLDDAFHNPDAFYHFYDYSFLPERSPQSAKRCIAQLKAIQAQMAKNDPDVLFFESEYYNGIWQAKIQKGRNQHYEIKIEYLNGECAYTLWI